MIKPEGVLNELQVIKGAIYGKPYKEVNPLVFQPSEVPLAFDPNPKPPTLLQQLRGLLASREAVWADFATVDIHNLFRTLITFTDDHKLTVAKEHFPVKESLQYIEMIIGLAQTYNRPLYLPEQLGVALDITKNRVLPSVILCHSASRAIGRNRDKRVDPTFNFPDETITEWSRSIACFSTNTSYDPPGDTYHFWATTTMGMVLKKHSGSDPITCSAYGILFYFGADIMDGARRIIARNPLHFKHREIDRIGIKIGWELAKTLP